MCSGKPSVFPRFCLDSPFLGSAGGSGRRHPSGDAVLVRSQWPREPRRGLSQFRIGSL